MKRWVLATLLAALLGASCGQSKPSGDTGTTPASDRGFPVVVNGVVISNTPTAIVSGSASHTEMLYAIGAGRQIVATDLFSDYPDEARSTAKIDSFNLSVESLASLEPDLVILAFDPGDVVQGLAELGIPTLLFDAPDSLEDAFDQVLDVGAATGNSGEADVLVNDMRRRVDMVVENLPQVIRPFTYFHELDPTYFTVSSETFIGSLYGRLGLVNIADAAEAGPYPQLSAEFIVAADPDFIFLADTLCCGQDAASVADRPGWASMSAVPRGVVELDDSVASRWGPRIVDLLEAVAVAVYVPVE